MKALDKQLLPVVWDVLELVWCECNEEMNGVKEGKT